MSSEAVTVFKDWEINDIYLDEAFFFEGRNLNLFGGAGSGKSFGSVQKVIYRIYAEVNEKGESDHLFLGVRKVGATLKGSLIKLFKRCLQDLGLWGGIKYNKVDKTFLFSNGGMILFTGLDDSEKLKSIDGVTGILVEEATELEENDLLQLQMRLRGKTAFYKQIILCFNPVSAQHFLVPYVEPQLLEEKKRPNTITEIRVKSDKVWEFDSILEIEKDVFQTITTKTINTTHKDNLLIDAEYRGILKLLAAISDLHYIVYEMGRWGEDVTGNPYAHAFKVSKHVKHVKLDPTLELHYTTDFNVVPYMSGIVIQKQWVDEYMNGKKGYVHVKIIKDYALKHPENTGLHLGKAFIDDHFHLLNQPFSLYGDASGNNRTGHAHHRTLFAELESGFGEHIGWCTKKVPTQNPRYNPIKKGEIGRKNFLNLLLDGKVFNVLIEIDPSCEKLISDLRDCKQDKHGKLSKKKQKNEDGIVCEVNGHHLQALEYFLCHKDVLGYLTTQYKAA